MFAPLLFNIFLAVVINGTYTRFKVDKDIMDALMHLRKETRRGAAGSNRPKASPGDSRWGMLYADDAGVVSQPPKQLRNMMGVIVVVCLVVDLTYMGGQY